MTTQAINGLHFYKCNLTFTRFHAAPPWSKNALQIPSWRRARPNVEVFRSWKESGEQEKTLTSTERTCKLHHWSLAFQKSSKPKRQTERVIILQHWLKGPHGIKHTWGYSLRNMQNWLPFPSDIGHWLCLIYGNSFHQNERSSGV